MTARLRLMNKGHVALGFENDLDLHAATRVTRLFDTAYAPSTLFDGGQASRRDLACVSRSKWWPTSGGLR